ncbi:MAG: hypothetical protein ACLUOI_23555 [Eisenbergiella sp.]
MQSEERYPGYREDERPVGVVPSPRQIAHQKMEYFGFIHFTVNTFTGREWGNGGGILPFLTGKTGCRTVGSRLRSGEA